MRLEELLKLMEATGHLNSVQEIILRQAWESKTYSNMAQEYHFDADYLKKVAHKLWHIVSALLGKSISKVTFRSIVESLETTPQQQQLITNYHFHLQQQTLTSYNPSNTNPIEFPGHLIPLGSTFYIERPPLETIVFREIEQPGNIIWIKAPQKMGKSSLLERIIARANSQGYQTVIIDFQQITVSHLQDLDQFFRWLCLNITQKLELNLQLDNCWQQEIDSKVNCIRYFKQYLLPQINHPLVIGLDGTNLLSHSPSIIQEIVMLLRSCYEESKRFEIMKQIRFIVLHSTEIEIPFYPGYLNSIGLPIKLPPFSIGQTQELALRYQLDWAIEAEGIQQLKALQRLLGGHPYLTQLAFYYLAQTDMTLDELLQQAPTMSGIYHDFLLHYLMILNAQPQLANAYKQVIHSEHSLKLNPVLAHQLENMGLVTLRGNQIIPSCQLYQLYFATHLG
ncbi:MAG: AAA-like domain-containing protein [Microcoleaceae cyanobacterium]